MLEHLKTHLKGKLIILGIGNAIRGDDGAGSYLAQRLQGKVPWMVCDAADSPENYLGKLVKEKPDTVLIIDAVDFGAKPGEFSVLEAEQVKTANLFSTHNASISLTINFLQSELKVDIIVLIIQPKSIALGDELSPEINQTLSELEHWFRNGAQEA